MTRPQAVWTHQRSWSAGRWLSMHSRGREGRDDKDATDHVYAELPREFYEPKPCSISAAWASVASLSSISHTLTISPAQASVA